MKRIQKKNFYDYEWKKNSNAVYIGRPSKYGNPFKLSDMPLGKCLGMYRLYLQAMLKVNPYFLDELKGKDLVCFCPLDKPCHGDIIIEYLEKGSI
jgi:hypothetical protein